MKLPGKNSITLTESAVCAAIELALNRGQGIDPPIRVISMTRTTYKGLEFEVTTDPVERTFIEVPPPRVPPPMALDEAALIAAYGGDESSAPESVVAVGGTVETGDTLL